MRYHTHAFAPGLCQTSLEELTLTALLLQAPNLEMGRKKADGRSGRGGRRGKGTLMPFISVLCICLNSWHFVCY